MPGRGKFGVALIQHTVVDSKEENVNHCLNLIKEAVVQYRPKFVCLPENFNSHYGEHFFQKYAEVIPGEYTTTKLSEAAKEHQIYIIAGYPERDPKNPKTLYNTALAFGPDGKILAKHRKVHLYDVDIKGVHKFNETSCFVPGTTATVFEAEGCKFGIAICHDIYYEEFWKIYRKKGVDMMFWPAAYHPSLGHHWDLMVRSRANDNQFYFAAMSAKYDVDAFFTSWGRSMVADPWGRIMVQAGKDEEIIYTEVDMDQIGPMRQQIPSWTKRRTELYEVIPKTADNAC